MKRQITLNTDFLSLIFVIGLAFALWFFNPEVLQEGVYVPRNPAEQIDSTDLGQDKPDPDKVHAYLIEIGVEHPEIVTAQAVVETGWFTCTNCSLDFNNLFGFVVGGDYLRFDTWQESCDYYQVWQQNRYVGGDYYEFLRVVGYAVDSLYEEKVRNVANTVSIIPPK
jgi:hypothetical protein